jgi:hypothetical protein
MLAAVGLERRNTIDPVTFTGAARHVTALEYLRSFELTGIAR